jgi:hypothetical protein
MTLSGSTITQWNDKSGNGKNATANGTPTYSSTSLNGRPGITFAGSPQSFTGSLTNTSNTLTVFTVINYTTLFTSSDMRIVSLGVSGQTDYSSTAYCIPITTYGTNPNRLATNRNQVTISDFGPITVGSLFLTSTVYNGIDGRLFVNGTLASYGAPTSSTQNFGYSMYAIGSGITGIDFFRGVISEVIIYHTALTTSQRQQVEGYLAHKWGLTGYYAPKTPLSIPGCQLWLDGADPAGTGTPPANGATVSTWVDKSGNGRNATPTGTAPTYTTNIFNGYSAPVFNGTTMVTPSYLITTDSKLSIFVLCKKTGLRQAGGNSDILGIAAGYQYFALYIRTALTNYLEVFYQNTPVSLTTYAINDGTNLLVSILTNGLSIDGYLSGTSVVSSTPNNGYSMNNLTSQWRISPEQFVGPICEIIVFNSTFTTSQRQTIEGYLAKKWSIGSTSMIPSTHPFSKIPPHLRLFRPNDVTGCQLWLDAADLSVVTIATGVSQWRDKSGNANNLTQSTTGAQPTHTSSLITFESNKYLNIPTAVLNNLPTWSVFFVINPISSSNWILAKQRDGVNTYNILSMTYNTNSGGGGQTGSTGFLYWRSLNNAGQLVSTAAITTSTLQILNLTYDGTNLYFYKNGILEKTTAGTFAIPNDTSPSAYTMGAWIQGVTIINSGVTNFSLGEMLVYNTGLTTAQRQQIEWYLVNKWGLFSTSPVSTPLTIPGCGIWLDGADTSSLTLSGSSVSQWRDKSGSSNHFTPTSGTPTSISDNGKTVVNFTSGTIMRSTNQITFTTSSALFIVSKITSVVSWGNMLIGFSDINGSDYSIRFEDYILRGTRGNANSADFVNDNYYVNGTFNPSFGSSTYLNAYSLIATVAPQGGGTSYITLSSGFMSRNFVGNIAEFLFYPGGVTNIQRQKIEGYLANKWGLTLPAPTVHPYDKYPPATVHSVAIPTTVRLINLGASGGGTSGSFTMNSLVGGGTGTFTNSPTFDGSSGTWGMAQCFDGARSGYDLYMVDNPNFMELVFPRGLMVTKIFLVPREQQDAFPSSLTLKANGTLVGTYTSTTVSQALGMGIGFTGTGFYIQPATFGTTWRFDFTSTPVSFGEIEFWGYLPT